MATTAPSPEDGIDFLGEQGEIINDLMEDVKMRDENEDETTIADKDFCIGATTVSKVTMEDGNTSKAPSLKDWKEENIKTNEMIITIAKAPSRAVIILVLVHESGKLVCTAGLYVNNYLCVLNYVHELGKLNFSIRE